MSSRIFIVGIGGTLMGSLAILAKEAGNEVRGCDKDIYPPMSTQLEQENIEVHEDFHSDLLEPLPDDIIIANANLPRGAKALEYILERKLPYTSGAEWLGKSILRQRHVVGVAGTHGKTTTTSIVAWILHYAGKQPGFLVGGVPLNFNRSTRLGLGPVFVVEADEYDTSYFDRRSKFLHYRPDTLIINNIEFDHADIFDDLKAIQFQFHHLIRTVPRNGRIFVPYTSTTVNEVLEMGCWSPVSYIAVDTPDSRLDGMQLMEDYWYATMTKSDGSEFDFSHNGRRVGHVSWEMQGEHNVNNALFAIATAYHLGIRLNVATEALASFKGVKRRMEKIASSKNIIVYDDFAHHPTAIHTTLDGLRKRVGNEEILAVIEPGTHTMSLGTFQSELANCCANASEVIWFRGERIKWSLAELAEGSVVPARVFSKIDDLVDEICQEPNARRHVVIMSNSSFGGIYQRIKDRLGTS